MLKDKFDDIIPELIDSGEEKVFPVFPLPITVARAESSCIYDTEGKKYIDLTSNRENNPLGYSNIYADEENQFLDAGLFDSHGKIRLEEALLSLTGMNKAYFSSEPGEIYRIASELTGAYLDKTDKTKVLLCVNPAIKNFYRIENISAELMPLNRNSLLKTLFSREVGAIVVQPVSINDDITIADDDYLREARNLCDKNNALFILDCSNISPLRLNNGLYNYTGELKPDLVIVSKGMAQGLPLSCLIASDRLSEITVDEAKSAVYSPAYVAAERFIEDYKNGKTYEIIDSSIDYINKKLAELLDTHISFVDFYSTGMLYTMVVDIPAYKFAEEAFKHGVIVNKANGSKISLLPPYNIQKEEIDYFTSVFDKIFDSLASYDRLK